MALEVVRRRVNVEGGAHRIQVEGVDGVEVRGAAADAGGVEKVRGRGGTDVGLDGGGLGGAEANFRVGLAGELALEAVGGVLAVDFWGRRGGG